MDAELHNALAREQRNSLYEECFDDLSFFSTPNSADTRNLCVDSQQELLTLELPHRTPPAYTAKIAT